MVVQPRPRLPFALLAGGLLGAALYPVAARAGLPAALAGDAAHGVWLGVCLGLEVLGLVTLRKARRTPR
ncbi:hypothetical protein J421_5304 (plasmid) [Gemmatirosa kalamazoonensis]|uniref:Uncharacterized protein n=1 Tax=Gemmatirosa kalamazoonensis TaxID=861299 RepID=W0RPA9_9BACT|nr:hypothetical protein J421_5304 [Gemmatirosa kalamazoonensis]